MKALSPEQLAAYREHGYLFPLPALGPAHAAQRLADLEAMERRIGAPLTQADWKWRGGAHVYSSWVSQFVRDPRILDVVEDVIGPDILVFWSTFFIKEPGGPGFTAWHQDATYFGLAPYEHVTAWVALTDASELAGCMNVLSAHGHPRQMHHQAARLKDSINGAGQVIVEPLDDRDAVAMQLHAGEMSLHHTLCCHRSAPNRADHRRVGFGISYVPAHVHGTGTVRLQAMLVRGENRYDHFELLPEPSGEFEPADLARHERAYVRFRENYHEQERLHEKAFGSHAASAA